MIKPMEQHMLAAIRILGSECFNRTGSCRSMENLTELLSNHPAGCFVEEQENEIVGFIFVRVLGNVGFVGPVGVKPDRQGAGLGKGLMRAGCDALVRAGCTAIGLEVLPELGNNIGLYQKLGFVPTFSTITYKKKSIYERMADDYVIEGKDVNLHLLELFDRSFRNEHGGYSFLKDIKAAISHEGSSICFYKERDVIAGFLCYDPLINPFVWGAFLTDYVKKEMLERLFCYIEKRNPGEALRIRINTRYKKAASMIDNSFEVERCLLRMMLNGYESEYMIIDEKSIIIHSWVG